jgi:NAD(P)H-hydrate epimerase
MEYINPSEMRTLDINSAYFGVGYDELMKNAGRAIFEELLKIDGINEKSVAVLCGPGDNGGDGFVTALNLIKDGFEPEVYLVGKSKDIRTREAKRAFDGLVETGVKVVNVSQPEEISYKAEVILDALLGTGIKGDPKEPYRGIIKEINISDAYKVSLDIPSGLGSKVYVKADLVITLQKAKLGLEDFNATVKDIGIPEKASTHVGPGDLITDLRRSTGSHKGENGRVMVVAGGIEYFGAPILTGLSALGAGADLVTLFVPDSILEAAMSHSPDLIIRGYWVDHLNP